jgi:hypothetical protein
MKKTNWCYDVCYTNINEDIIRVYNMRSLHGIIICSPRGLLGIQKCMLEGYFKNIIWDIFTAQIQPFYNVYALKIPLVYQYGEIGGQERQTKIEYNNNFDKNIDMEWINKNNVSTITCFEDPFYI